MSSATSFLLLIGTLLFFRSRGGAPEAEHVRQGPRGHGCWSSGTSVSSPSSSSSRASGSMFWQVFLLAAVLRARRPPFRAFEILETVDAWSDHPPHRARRRADEEGAADPRDDRGLRGGERLVARHGAFSQSWQGVVVAMFLFALGEATAGAALLRVRGGPGAEGADRHLHGLRVPAGRDRLRSWPGRSAVALVAHYVKGGANPAGMWIVLAAIGFGATILMLLYDRFLAPRRAAA